MAVKHSAREPLTQERIIEAGLAIIDKEGLAQFSMRKLGARLGVEAMTLYHHVANKDAILDLLVGQVLARVGAAPVTESASWRERLRGFAVRYRAVLHEHPNLLPLIATRPVRTPGALRRVEEGLAVLREAGFSLDQCFHIANAVAMFVVGHALAEVGTTPGHEASAAPSLTAKSNVLPKIAKMLRDPKSAARSHQACFDFALDAMLDGFALQLR